jgi:hypothetical protein
VNLSRWLPLAVGVLVAAVVVAIESEVWVALVVVAALLLLPLAVYGLRKAVAAPGGPSRSWIAGALFIIVVAGAASVFELLSEKRTGPEKCSREYENPVSPGPARSGATRPVPVGPDGAKEADPELAFQFGHTKGAIIRRQSFAAKGAGAKSYGFALLADLTDEETGNDLPMGTIKGKIGSLAVLRAGIRLSVCIDPEPPGEPRINPGTYTGAVAIGTRAERAQALTPVPVTVSVADDRDLIALAAVFIGVIAGIIVRAAGDLSQATGRALDDQPADEKAPILPPDPKDYFFSLRFLVMVAGGLIGGLLVYGPLFADDPDATVDVFESLIPLAAAAFTATLAAKSIADLKGPTLRERAQGLSGKPLTVREQRALKGEGGGGDASAEK